MTVLSVDRLSLEEYLELDRRSEERWEFVGGFAVCMSGGTPEHSRLANKTAFLLSRELLPKGCAVYQADVRLKVPAMPPYRYADVTALCGTSEYELIGGVNALVNPVLIVEVLSPSTQLLDRTRKFDGYKSIESLKYYMLVSQDERFVLLYSRYNEKFWFQTQHVDGDVLNLEALECNLNVNEIYEGIIAGEN